MGRRSTILNKPLEAVEESGTDHYDLIYKKAGATPEVGSVVKVQTGDEIEYFDDGLRTGTVTVVTGHHEKRRVRTAPMLYKKFVLREAHTVFLKDITKVKRLKAGFSIKTNNGTLARRVSYSEPKPPEPLPEVTFAPVVNPTKPEVEVEAPKAGPKIIGPIPHREPQAVSRVQTTSVAVAAPPEGETPMQKWKRLRQSK